MKDGAADSGPDGGPPHASTLARAGGLDAAAQLSRLRWRCRRGMKELDVVLGRYLDGEYAGATDAARRAFEALLEWQDPELFACLVGRAPLPADPELADVLTILARYRD